MRLPHFGIFVSDKVPYQVVLRRGCLVEDDRHELCHFHAAAHVLDNDSHDVCLWRVVFKIDRRLINMPARLICWLEG